MKYINYCTERTCARTIRVSINDDNTISEIIFEGGCDGNHKAINALCYGKTVDEVISALEGITCGPVRGTSCGDQLSKALKKWKEDEHKA